MPEEMPDEKIRNPEGLIWSDLVGKYVLVGLTFQDGRGKVIEQKELHGRITWADARTGLTIELEGTRSGTSYELPPDLRSLKPAAPGEYRERSTGEVICDPDYLFTWIIERPDD
jgi:hypothetical protein